jgi:hypothetical protein
MNHDCVRDSSSPRATYPRLCVVCLNDENKRTLANFLYYLKSILSEGLSRQPRIGRTHLLVHDVERGLVDQAHVKTFFPALEHGVQGPVKHLSERNDITSLAIHDDLILPRLELVPGPEELFLSILLEDVRHLGSRREHEAQPAFKKHALDDGSHLQSISWKIEPRLGVGEAVVRKQRVDTWRRNQGACSVDR